MLPSQDNTPSPINMLTLFSVSSVSMMVNFDHQFWWSVWKFQGIISAKVQEGGQCGPAVAVPLHESIEVWREQRLVYAFHVLEFCLKSVPIRLHIFCVDPCCEVHKLEGVVHCPIAVWPVRIVTDPWHIYIIHLFHRHRPRNTNIKHTQAAGVLAYMPTCGQ